VQGIGSDPEPTRTDTGFETEALLMAAAYSIDHETGEPEIELYCKSRNGLSFIAFWRGFWPYFHALDPPEGLEPRLKDDPRVKEVGPIKLYHELQIHDALKVELRIPGQTPELREVVRNAGAQAFASDIIFTQRFIFDQKLGACIRVRGRRRKRDPHFQTKIQVDAIEIEESAEPFTVPLMTFCFDIENSIKDGTIYCIGWALDPGNGEYETGSFVGEERAMIAALLEFIERRDPDVITGYNIAGYDIPHIQERCKKLGLPVFTISRKGTELKEYMGRFLRADGRILTDTWWNVKRELHPKQETLQAVSMELFGEGKDDVDASNMDEEWRLNRQKVIQYCERDALLCLRIHNHLRVMEKYQSLAAVAKLPVDETINGRTSTLIDSILIRAADNAKSTHGAPVAVPMSRRDVREKPIEGGYVHAVKPGIHNWVCVLDFKSMYPSIMIANNICFTTLVRDGSGPIKAPNGASYLSLSERRGLLPIILENLMAQRDDLKKKSRMAQTPEQASFYNGLQEAVKILMNSFYGVMASSFYRFTDPKIGESITAFARENIRHIIDELGKEGIEVIYSDTDSVFFKSPEPNREGAIAVGKRIAQRFSTGGMSFEFEKVMNPFFSHGAKKRYVGKIVWPKEDVIYRGYEIRRTDAFDWQSKALSDVFELVLKEDKERLLEVARERVAEVRDKKVPKSALVISRSVRDVDDYDSKHKESLQNVRVMRMLQERGINVQPGMKVSWIVTGTKGQQGLTPYLGPESEKEIEPNWEFYAQRTAATLSRVTEVFGWDAEDLLGGKRSKRVTAPSLESGFGKAAENDPVSPGDENLDDEGGEAEVKVRHAQRRPTTSTGRPRPIIDKNRKKVGETEDWF
jgi:DNA polymerase, archaea type